MPLPGRPRVPVAVADVQRPGDVDVLSDDVDRLHGQLDVLGVPGQERLVDLQEVGAGRGQGAGLGVEPAGQRTDQVAGVVIGLVADPAGQRERAGEGELDRLLGELTGELVVIGQVQAGIGVGLLGERPGDLGVVVVEVVGLGPLRDVHAGDPGQEVVHVVVAAQLPVGDDVDAGQFLVLDRGLDRDLVDLGQVLGADPALVVLGLQAFQPFRDRVRAHDGGRQEHGFSPGPGR